MKANKAGHRIRVARFMANPILTQDELAAKMRMRGFLFTKNTLSRIENSNRHITDLELLAFAKVLKVSTAWLLEETNVP